MIDGGPMDRLEEVKRDVNAPSVVFQRLTDGETLPEISKSWGCPKGRFVEWFTTEHADLYDAALKVRAADLALEALQDANDATPETVGASKLRVDTKKWFASRLDRSRFGERAEVKLEVEDKRPALGHDALVLEVGRKLSYMLHRAATVASDSRPVAALPAPIDITPVPSTKEEKNASDAGVI